MAQLKTMAVDEIDWIALRNKFEKPNFKYNIEDEGDWFSFIHGDTDISKYVYFYFIPVDKTEVSFSAVYQRKEVTNSLIQTLSNNAFDYKYNMYMCPACLKGKTRESDNAWNTEVIVLDLDYYDTKYKNLSPYELLKHIDFKGAYPSGVACSGKGVYLIYKLANKQVLGTSKAAAMMETVKKALIEHFKDYGCDSRCKDPTHIFRMIGTRHFKDGLERQSYIMEQNEKTYDILELLEIFEQPIPKRVLKKIEPPKVTTPNTRPNSQAAFVSTNSYRFYNLAIDRLDDLQRLLEIRKYDLGTGSKDDKTSCRNEFLFMIALHSFYSMNDAITTWNLIEYFNSQLTSPLDLKDIDVIVNSANDNNEKRLQCQELAEQLKAKIKAGEAVSKADKEKTFKFYRYKNSTIVKNLFITDEESKEMKQLMTDTVKKERKAERDRIYYANNKQKKKDYYEQRTKESKLSKRQQMKQELESVAIMMIDGLTMEQMAERLNCSVSKIKQLKRKVKELNQ